MIDEQTRRLVDYVVRHANQFEYLCRDVDAQLKEIPGSHVLVVKEPVVLRENLYGEVTRMDLPSDLTQDRINDHSTRIELEALRNKYKGREETYLDVLGELERQHLTLKQERQELGILLLSEAGSVEV